MHPKLTVHSAPAPVLSLPKLWYQNNAVKTHFFNALSTLFPQGENFFIWSLRQLEERARTPLLKEQIEDFVTQEKNHAALHKAYNRCLAKAGYNIAKMEEGLRIRISLGQRYMSPLMCLAITMGTEHITAVLSEKVLQRRLIPDDVDSTVRKIWIWHAMEEIDHKAVAMNLFQDAGGTYAQKVWGMLWALGIVWGNTALRMLHMLWRDRQLHRIKTWWQMAELLFGMNGLAWLVTVDILKYFTPGFHPARHDNYELVAYGRTLLESQAAAEGF